MSSFRDQAYSHPSEEELIAWDWEREQRAERRFYRDLYEEPPEPPCECVFRGDQADASECLVHGRRSDWLDYQEAWEDLDAIEPRPVASAGTQLNLFEEVA